MTAKRVLIVLLFGAFGSMDGAAAAPLAKKSGAMTMPGSVHGGGVRSWHQKGDRAPAPSIDVGSAPKGVPEQSK